MIVVTEKRRSMREAFYEDSLDALYKYEGGPVTEVMIDSGTAIGLVSKMKKGVIHFSVTHLTIKDNNTELYFPLSSIGFANLPTTGKNLYAKLILKDKSMISFKCPRW